MRLSSRLFMAVSALLGLFASSYLLFVYITHGPITCGLNGGCELVRASKWAHVGMIPLPAFGVAFYLGILALLVMRLATSWRGKELYWLIRFGAAIGFIESLSLFFIQWIEIKAFCTWCLLSGVAATGIFLTTWWDRPALTPEEREYELNQLFRLMIGWMVVSVIGFWLLTR